MNPVLLWFHQLGSPPIFDRFAARWAPWGFGLGLLGMAIGLYGALFVVPPDYQQGDSFRILYIHVPAAWMSMMVYALMAVYAAIALIWHIKLCEVLAMASSPPMDANIFSLSREGRSKEWAKLALDPAMPLNNRAAVGGYEPASTWKAVVSLASLKTGLRVPLDSAAPAA